MKALGVAVLPLTVLLAAPTHAETRSEVRFLASYLSGTFATGGEVHVIALPAVFAVISERHEFRLSVPYLSITSEQPVTFVGDHVIERTRGRGGTQSGPGDVLAEEEYFLVAGGGSRPWLSILLQVKLPTADESKGLGTGEPDTGAGMGLTQPLGDRWHLLGQAQYVVRGDPPDVDYRNTLWLSIGLQRRGSDSSSASLSYERRQSVRRDRPDVAELYVGYDRGLARRVNLRGGVYLGLSDTAEDYGVSAGFSVH